LRSVRSNIQKRFKGIVTFFSLCNQLLNAGNPELIPELRKSFINEIGNSPMLEYVVWMVAKVAFVMLNFKILPCSTIAVKLTKKSLI